MQNYLVRRTAIRAKSRKKPVVNFIYLLVHSVCHPSYFGRNVNSPVHFLFSPTDTPERMRETERERDRERERERGERHIENV